MYVMQVVHVMYAMRARVVFACGVHVYVCMFVCACAHVCLCLCVCTCMCICLLYFHLFSSCIVLYTCYTHMYIICIQTLWLYICSTVASCLLGSQKTLIGPVQHNVVKVSIAELTKSQTHGRTIGSRYFAQRTKLLARQKIGASRRFTATSKNRKTGPFLRVIHHAYRKECEPKTW